MHTLFFIFYFIYFFNVVLIRLRPACLPCFELSDHITQASIYYLHLSSLPPSSPFSDIIRFGRTDLLMQRKEIKLRNEWSKEMDTVTGRAGGDWDITNVVQGKVKHNLPGLYIVTQKFAYD